MIKPDEKGVIRKAQEKFGHLNQLVKTAEECSELAAKLNKFHYKQIIKGGELTEKLVQDILEEVADVYITLEYAASVFGKKAIRLKIIDKLKKLEREIEG